MNPAPGLRAAGWVLLPAFLLHLWPQAASALRFERDAIGAGEWWRLWSGHWVHFSAPHLFWDALVLGLAGTWLEHRRRGLLAWHLLATAPAVSLLLLGLEEDMRVYGGLSGLGVGAIVLLALTELVSDREHRAWWIALLALVAAKIGAEAATASPWFALEPGIRLSAWAHPAGALSGLLVFAALRLARSVRRTRPAPGPPDSASEVTVF
ncbi:MAG TPA: rhombosortase [Opitutaceae bacterium]|nr:rhombosortase [Opitutaceae bacterium]